LDVKNRKSAEIHNRRGKNRKFTEIGKTSKIAQKLTQKEIAEKLSDLAKSPKRTK